VARAWASCAASSAGVRAFSPSPGSGSVAWWCVLGDGLGPSSTIGWTGTAVELGTGLEVGLGVVVVGLGAEVEVGLDVDVDVEPPESVSAELGVLGSPAAVDDAVGLELEVSSAAAGTPRATETSSPAAATIAAPATRTDRNDMTRPASQFVRRRRCATRRSRAPATSSTVAALTMASRLIPVNASPPPAWSVSDEPPG
jgi:hypothetical protein